MGSFKRLQQISKIIKESYVGIMKSNNSTLFLNYNNSDDLRTIHLPNIDCFTPFKSQRDKAEKIGLKVIKKISKRYETVITSVPKSREEALAQIARAYKSASLEGILIIEGENRNGVNNVVNKLSEIIRLDHLSSKSHGKIIIVKVNQKKNTSLTNWLNYSLPTINKDGYFSMPGLFSYEHVDLASKFLTSAFNKNLKGDVLDLGAGWGFLSFELVKKCFKVKSVILVDHDQRALDCAKLNVKSKKASFKWIDINDVAELSIKFDTVICNPPFHSHDGKNLELGRSFIKAAHDSLKQKGRLLLVANIQLPYENTIKNLFHDFEIHSQNKYFKIILAKRPKKHYDISY